MKAVIFVAFLAVSALAEPIRIHNFPARAELTVEFCNDNTANYLQNLKVDVEPLPVEVAEGKTVVITAGVDLAQAIEMGSIVDLRLKKTGAIPIVIPCLNVGLPVPIGSCVYDGSELCNVLQLCPDHCPAGQANDLPLNPGHYGGDGLSITFPKIPDILKPFLKGNIEAIAKVKDAAGNENICLKLNIQLTV